MSQPRSSKQSSIYIADRMRPDGAVLCFCDKPAIRLVSHTEAHPEEVFYKCNKHKQPDGCPFWKWASDLALDLAVQVEEEGQVTFNAQRGDSGPSTPSRKLFLSPPSTPQSTPSKRPHSTVPSPLHMMYKTPTYHSPEAKKIRLRAIEEGLNSAMFSGSSEPKVKTISIQTDPSASDDDSSNTDGYEDGPSLLAMGVKEEPTELSLSQPSQETSVPPEWRSSSQINELNPTASVSMVGMNRPKFPQQQSTRPDSRERTPRSTPAETGEDSHFSLVQPNIESITISPNLQSRKSGYGTFASTTLQASTNGTSDRHDDSDPGIYHLLQPLEAKMNHMIQDLSNMKKMNVALKEENERLQESLERLTQDHACLLTENNRLRSMCGQVRELIEPFSPSRHA